MKHKVKIKYEIKYVWIGIILMMIGGVILFSVLKENNVDYGITEIVTYIAGVSATMTLLYHSFNLEYQITTQKKNTKLLRAKHTYDILSKWSHPNMRECVNEVRSVLKEPERIKELEDVNKIELFDKYLVNNKEHRSFLVQTLNYFENIAILMDTNYVDKDMIKVSFKSLFTSYYKVLKNYIDFRQKEYPDSWMYFEELCKKWIAEDKVV